MKKLIQVLTCSLLITATVGLVGCEKSDKISMSNTEKIKNMQLPLEKGQSIDFDVFFDASKDEKKVEIAKESISLNKEELIGEIIMNQLIKGPSIQSTLNTILPKETRLISFSIKDGVAIVNLSKEVIVMMSPGKEEASLRCISSSLTQLASISKVKILVENKNVETLGGNYDISKPFGKDEIIARKK